MANNSKASALEILGKEQRAIENSRKQFYNQLKPYHKEVNMGKEHGSSVEDGKGAGELGEDYVLPHEKSKDTYFSSVNTMAGGNSIDREERAVESSRRYYNENTPYGPDSVQIDETIDGQYYGTD